MSRPIPTQVVHFTHVDHLETVVENGLLADTTAKSAGLLTVEVGNQGIKDQRRRRAVPVAPGGVVADYVPFYFAPRSPMMSAIEHGRVPTYTAGCDDLIYLVTTVEQLEDLGLTVLYTDRNATLAFAKFSDDSSDLATLIDWELMRAKYWSNTDQDPERRERRMAECLAHEGVPWEAFSEVVARNEACAASARAVLARLGESTGVVVRPDWYF